MYWRGIGVFAAYDRRIRISGQLDCGRRKTTEKRNECSKSQNTTHTFTLSMLYRNKDSVLQRARATAGQHTAKAWISDNNGRVVKLTASALFVLQPTTHLGCLLLFFLFPGQFREILQVGKRHHSIWRLSSFLKRKNKAEKNACTHDDQESPIKLTRLFERARLPSMLH